MQDVEQLFSRVEKPGRYVGGEYNSVRKGWDEVQVRVAFAFPDVYEVGMSHLGLQILYAAVNDRADSLLERVFAPWPDMERLLRENNIPLFTLESRRPVKDFDILAFTLPYELTYTNVLNIIGLSGIDPVAEARKNDDPLVIAGGPCVFNPEPLASFIDLFAVGEGEEIIQEILDAYILSRKAGEGRREFLRRAAGVPGVYVPSLYQVAYVQGEVEGVSPLYPDVPARVAKRVIRDFDSVSFPVHPVVPLIEAVHDRGMLEVFRGCTRGCRFCQAGVIYRPVREKKKETLINQGLELARNTGYDEISLSSLSSVDYSSLSPLIDRLLEAFNTEQVSISLPSLRADAFSVGIARRLQEVRKSALTFAPEAGSQRLRDVINKKVTREALLSAAEAAFASGWLRLKLYFIIGLPTETEEDLEGIGVLASDLLAVGEKCGVPRGRLQLTVSASCFVPKAHTPFQWEPMAYTEALNGKITFLKNRLKDRRIDFDWHDPRMSFMEAVFSRGDRRLGGALLEAHRSGFHFDGWREYFSLERWEESFARAGLDPAYYAYHRYNYSDVLPWDHIDSGVSRDFLMEEHQRAYRMEPTADCREGECAGCGVCTVFEVEPVISEVGDRMSEVGP
ncbi:MAG: TIGR03960 family B12-binding radical SAM protein [Bacillota bacterium]